MAKRYSDGMPRAHALAAARRGRWAVPLALIAGLAACTAPEAIPEPSAPPVRPAPPPAPLPAPVASTSWEDWPFTPGTWVYRRDEKGSLALFGLANQGAQFTIRCDRAGRRIYLSRPGFLEVGKSANMVLRASNGSGQYPLANATGSTPPYVAAVLSPADPMLDKLAFSRGRFVVEVAGAPAPLVVPAYPELSRVIEDCR